ncbi:MAG: STAS domain-containing protein [Hydrogenovibrio sp.]|nr:STAS domain-containing protein [Hydrogenovibrio sp.]
MKAVNLSEQSAYVVEGSKLKLSGELTVNSIGQLFKKNPWINERAIEEIDCSLITSADSSCLALLIYLQDKSQKKLRIVNFPKDLSGLVELYELEPFLSI